MHANVSGVNADRDPGRLQAVLQVRLGFFVISTETGINQAQVDQAGKFTILWKRLMHSMCVFLCAPPDLLATLVS